MQQRSSCINTQQTFALNYADGSQVVFPIRVGYS